MLIDSLREHHLAGDMSRGDVYFYYTTPCVSSVPLLDHIEGHFVER